MDNLPLVILDDADFTALFGNVSRRDILCNRCISVLALCVLAFVASAVDTLPASEVWGVDALVMGVARHSQRTETADENSPHMREVNPGIGLSLSHVIGKTSEDWRADALVQVGTYVDSYDERARFAMLGMRWTWRDRLCSDLSAGYYKGSGFHGFGVVPTLGVRIAGPVWIHATGSPVHDEQTCAFVGIFARVHWSL